MPWPADPVRRKAGLSGLAASGARPDSPGPRSGVDTLTGGTGSDRLGPTANSATTSSTAAGIPAGGYMPRGWRTEGNPGPTTPPAMT